MLLAVLSNFTKRLGEGNPDVLRALENDYGTGYGKGGGAPYRPDSAIAACLQDWPEHVEVQYLLGRDRHIADIEATDGRMEIYRWIA